MRKYQEQDDDISESVYRHIYNRGSDKRKIFMDEKDCERFLECLEFFNTNENRTVRDYKEQQEQIQNRRSTSGSSQTLNVCFAPSKLVEIFCYCLMPNHYHLILKELVEGGMAQFMKKVNGGYTKYFNAKHERSGSLFQGRYKSKEIDADFYLTYLTGYIHINPVMAGIVKKPEYHKYSSYLDYLGQNKTPFLELKPEELEVKIEDYEKFTLDLVKDKEALEKVKAISWEE